MLICFSGFKGSGKDSLAAYLIKNYAANRVSFADPLKDMVAQEFGVCRSFLDDPKFKESPLIGLPVDPKDGFSRMIAEFMVKEFRSACGKTPRGFKYHKDGYYGIFTVLEANGEIFDQHKDQGRDVRDGLCKVYQTPRSLAILKGSTNRSVRSDYWVNKAFESVEAHLKENKMVVISDLRYKSEAQQIKNRFGDKAVLIRINRFKESPSTDPSELDLNDYKFHHYIDNTGSLEEAYKQLEEILVKLNNI